MQLSHESKNLYWKANKKSQGKFSPLRKEWELKVNIGYVLQEETEEFPLLTAKKGQLSFTTKPPHHFNIPAL